MRFACNGECPKHRFIATPDGEAGLNYLCAGYKKFFRHIDPYMQTMANLLKHQQPAALIMEMLREEETTGGMGSGTRMPVRPGRNAPCPCGSGKKYKKCCGVSAL